MERKIVEYRCKGLFKSAVAIGAGLAVGKTIGAVINRAMVAIVDNVFERLEGEEVEKKDHE